MHAVPDTFEHPLDAAEFKRPAHRPGVELYRAHIVRHAFEPHTHEAFGLGAIESGVERFRYRGEEHLAPADAHDAIVAADKAFAGWRVATAMARAKASCGWPAGAVSSSPVCCLR